MASGVITGAFTGGSSSSHFTYKLIWSSTPDPANLRSIVNFGWYVVCDGSGWYTNKQNAPWSWSGAGQSDSGTENFNYPNPQTLVQNGNTFFRSDTIVVSHSPDGTKSFTISGAIDLSGTSAGSGSLSGDIVLDRIATTPPTINSFSITDIGTAYSAVGAYVAGFTKLKFSVSATTGDSAIASYAFYRDTTLIGSVNTSSGTVNHALSTFEPAGSFVYSVTVTDSYGLSATYSLASVTILDYTMPTITASTFRCNSGGAQDNEGTYGRFDMSWTVANVGSNTAVVHKVTVNGTDYTSFPQIISGLLTTTAYSAVYTVTDSLGKTAKITQTVQPSFVHIDLYPSSNGGVGIGEAAQEDKFIVNQSSAIFRNDLSAKSLTLTNALPPTSGGTGVSTSNGLKNLIALDVVSVSTQYNYTTTDSLTTAHERTYTVGANAGLVWVSASVQCDDTDDGGDFIVLIQKNGTTIAVNQWGLPSGQTKAQYFGCQASAFLKVNSGDTIKIYTQATKTGDKTRYFNLLAFKCTLTAS